jgi:NitT/TauT family transport system substrate-binding protein
MRSTFTRRHTMAMLGAAMASPSAARAQVRELRVMVQYGLSYLPVMLMEDEGIFAEEARKRGIGDVKLTLLRVSGSNSINEGLLAGTTDMGAMGTPSLHIAYEKTRGAIKGLCSVNSYPMVLNTVAERIKTLADVQPADRIALPASTSPQNIILRMAAQKQFNDAKKFDANVVALPHPDAMTALLAGTEITGHFTNAPFAQFEAADPRVHRVLSSADVLGTAATFILLAATARYVEANRDIAETVVASAEEAMRRIAADPEKAATAYLKREPSKMSVSSVADILTDRENAMGIAPTGVMAYADFMASSGQLKAKPAKWENTFFPYVHDRQGS